ncbi:hypothetical protein D3C85_483350 [compost metagenome]
MPYADQLHTWADENGARHALTLTLGVWPSRSFDPEASFRPHLKKLFRAIAHEVFDIPKRHLPNMSIEEMPWFAGMVENTTRSGASYPHIHGYIAIPNGLEPLVRGVLRERWGQDASPDLPAHVIREWEAIPAPSMPVAQRAVIPPRFGFSPTFELRQVLTPGWASYSLKKPGAPLRGIWTTPEILH